MSSVSLPCRSSLPSMRSNVGVVSAGCERRIQKVVQFVLVRLYLLLSCPLAFLSSLVASSCSPPTMM